MVSATFSDLLQRVRSRTSLERLRPTSSRSSPVERKRSTGSYSSYSVHQQPASPVILRHGGVTAKILEHVAEAPGGKRMLTKLARTCKSLFEPSADAIWKELDSLVPLVGLFPSHLLRRSKRPGLGFAKVPEDEDWDKVLSYGERVQKITYNESMYNVSPNIFPIIDEYRPRLYILPNLQTLVWRCETPAGLERSLLFLNPRLEHLVLDIGMRIPNFAMFAAELPNRTKLATLTISSITPLPENFTQAMKEQRSLERLSLSVPGALTPSLGRWIASLPKLRSLQLDLTARSVASIDAFFEGVEALSGYSTPSSFGATDSGVFSGEDMDIDVRKDLRKSALRVTGDYPTVHFTRPGPYFPQLEEVHLTGDAATLAAFLKHLHGEVTTLELTIDDPPERVDWKDLCSVLDKQFPESLRTIRVVPTSASRPELVRTLSRGEPAVITPQPLSLRDFPNLPQLQRLDVDLLHSVIFTNADIEALAIACPALEVLRLCPTARFPVTSEPPTLTLDGLAPLMRHCRRLHTLAIVVNALPSSEGVLASSHHSSPSLLRLNVGHSWAKDPLQAAILLSHLAPRLHVLRFFHEANRPGYVASHASAWQQAANFLPHLQRLRAAERRASNDALERLNCAQSCAEGMPMPPERPTSLNSRALDSIAEDDHSSSGSVDMDFDGLPEVALSSLVEKADKAVDTTLARHTAVKVEAFVQTEPDSHRALAAKAPDVPETRSGPPSTVGCAPQSSYDAIQRTRVPPSEALAGGVPRPHESVGRSHGADGAVRQSLAQFVDELTGARAETDCLSPRRPTPTAYYFVSWMLGSSTGQKQTPRER